MNTRVELRRGIYRDSVVLMQVSQAVAACHGVAAAIVAMATPLNIEIYERLGFDPAEVKGASQTIFSSPSVAKTTRSTRREPNWSGSLRHLRRRRATGSDHRLHPDARIRASPGRFPGTDLGAGSTRLCGGDGRNPGGSLGDAVLRQRSC